MNKKLGFLFSSGIFGIVLSSLVSAQNFTRSFKPFWDLIDYIVNVLPNGATKFVFYKFLLWMIFAVLLLILVPKLPFIAKGDETAKKNGKMLAWLLSLMMSLGIPNAILDLIFNQYAFFGAFFIIAIMPALLFMATDKAGTRLRGAAFLVAGLTIIAFTSVAASTRSWTNQSMIDWLMLAGSIMMIIGIVMLVAGGSMGSTSGTTTTPTPTPAVPPTPGAPNDAEIRRLQGEIGSLGTDITNLHTLCTTFNTLLTGIAGAPAPYSGTPATHPRTTITTQASHIISEVRRIRRIAHDIQTHNQFMNVPAADRTAFAGHVTNLTRLYAIFMTDYTEALLRW